jgi:hypothetical protein
MRFARFSLCWAPLALATAAGQPGPDPSPGPSPGPRSAGAPRPGLDFEALAADFAERCGGASAVEEALAQGCERVAVGVFEVYYPKELEKEPAERVERALQALIDVQGAWLELFGDGPSVARGIDMTEALAKAHKSGDLATAEASAELAALLGGSEATGFAPVAARKARIVLAPGRRDFQQMVAFFGAADSNLRGLYWHDGVRVWTEFWWYDLQVVALEYPPVAGDGDDPGKGIPMDFREETGLEQHVAQRGTVSLAWYAFDEGLPPAIELGLAQMLVVACYGENNARSGGSVRGNATEAYEAFVPGGSSSGGALPPINADSPWRADKGEDHFVKVLRASQKAGSKKIPKEAEGEHEAIAWFQLRTENGTHGVRAPFLGVVSRGKEQPPEEFASDYLEFFRAYKTAFLHWLAEEGAGKAKESRAAFRALAAKVAGAGGKGAFEDLAAEVYGVPLSSEDGAEESLEWRFLAWLAKQR